MVDEDVDVLGYIQHKGWEIQKRERSEIVLRVCPLCERKPKKRNDRNFYINEESGLWNTYCCGEKGNLLSLKYVMGDIELIQPGFAGSASSEGAKMSERLRRARGSSFRGGKPPPAGIARKFHERLTSNAVPAAVEYLIRQRGFTKDTIKRFQLGVARRGYCNTCNGIASLDDQDLCPQCGTAAKKPYELIAIPYFQSGQILNFKFRSFTGEKRFEKWDGAPTSLFNADSMDGHYKTVIITEGEFDAITVAQLGYDAAVATGSAGKNIEDDWMDRLAFFDEVLIGYDSDKAGIDGAEKVATKLGRYRCRRIEWPLKDANQCLIAGMSQQEIQTYIDAAASYKVHQVKPFSDFGQELRDLKKQGPKAFGLQTRWRGINRLYGGHRGGEVIVYTGDTGCLDGDTVIQINRAGNGTKTTMRQLVHMFNGGIASGKQWAAWIPTYIQSKTEDQWWGLAKVIRAVDAGKQPTLIVEFSNGSTLVGTADHRVISGDAEIRFDQLRIGDVVQCKMPRARSTKQSRKSLYRQIAGLRRHPNATNPKSRHSPYRVPYHRLVMEAFKNEISIEDYITLLRSNANLSELKFLDRRSVVHHIDLNVNNNSIKNLEVLSQSDHRRLHGNAKSFGLRKLGMCSVTRISDGGLRDTYDLTIAGTQNYIANGIVTHNSGKSTFTTATALDLAAGSTSTGRAGVGVLIASFEMSVRDIARKLVCMHSDIGFKDMTEAELDRAINEVAGMQLFFVDQYGSMPLQELEDAIEFGVRRHGLWYVVLDHLHFFLEAKPDTERFVIDFTMRRLKSLALKLDICIAIVVHPAKLRTTREGKTCKVDLNDLKGSSEIKKAADIVTRVWRPRAEDRNDDVPPYAEITTLKCRSEFGCEDSCVLDFNPFSLRYEYSAGLLTGKQLTGGSGRKKKPDRFDHAKAAAGDVDNDIEY